MPRKNRPPAFRGTGAPIDCPHCHKPFVPRRPSQTYCRPKCRTDFNNARALAGMKMVGPKAGASEMIGELQRLATMTRPLLKSGTPFDSDLYRNVGLILDTIEGK